MPYDLFISYSRRNNAENRVTELKQQIEAERTAATEIVRQLGGFTLAVEVVAVHLNEKHGRISCAAFMERLQREGLTGYEGIASITKGGIKHGEKLLSLTLTPTLDLLSPTELLVLGYAAAGSRFQ